MLQHSQSSSGVKEPPISMHWQMNICDWHIMVCGQKTKHFNATLKTDFDQAIGKINIIPQDIGRVLLNLINNAFYAVNERSKEQLMAMSQTVILGVLYRESVNDNAIR